MWSKSSSSSRYCTASPGATLDDHVFPDPVNCHTYLYQAYDQATMEVFKLDCAEK
jgi:hypothetical protein